VTSYSRGRYTAVPSGVVQYGDVSAGHVRPLYVKSKCSDVRASIGKQRGIPGRSLLELFITIVSG